ncbi:MAG: HAD-IA family hydrolase [Comamonadaceae bacterium]|nr:HAD-IA family hydrolase [Comamonadaceae bacterium]
MLDPSQIRAITLDLDDTLWPIWPTIRRAEEVLLLWLKERAALTAQLFATADALRAIRLQVQQERPDLHHDLSAMRLESIRLALRQAGDDENLAMAAFEIFFAERQRVQLFDDAQPLLEFLAARWPVVAVTNGNADVHRVGIGQYFRDSFNVARTGYAKPDARIFHCAAQALGLPPSAILHVGDDAKLDVVAARDAGMHAVWLNRSGIDWPLTDQHPPMTVASLTQLQALLTA